MRISKPSVLFCFVLLGYAVFAQELLPLSSNIYENMDLLYLLSGAGTPSNDRPWSKSEAAIILGRVDRSRLKPGASLVYQAIEAEIEPGLRFRFADGFGLDAALDLNLEAYTHSNTGFDKESDWIFGFEERNPLAKVTLGFGLDNLFAVSCDMQYGRNRFSYLDEFADFAVAYPGGVGAVVAPGESGLFSDSSVLYGPSFQSNLFAHSYDFDFQWPKRAVAAIGGKNWNLSLARDRIDWGNGKSGDFVIDDHGNYQDFARLVAFSDIFKYDWLTVFFETDPSAGELAEQKFRILAAHRLEFRIFGSLTFAVSENVMYQGGVPNLRYLNPSFIFHNINNRTMFNSIAHAELDWAIVPGVKIYGQYVLDQGRAPNESQLQSNSTGWLAGVEAAFAAGPGIAGGSLEYASTDPLLYRRDGIDYLMFRKYFTMGPGGGPGFVTALDYIGHPQGGDVQLLQLDAEYRLPGLGSLALRSVAARHGEMGFFTSHNLGGNNSGLANYEGSTPSGDRVSESLLLGLRIDWSLTRLLAWRSPTPWLRGASLWLRADWIGRRIFVKSSGAYEGAETDFQASAGVSIGL